MNKWTTTVLALVVSAMIVLTGCGGGGGGNGSGDNGGGNNGGGTNGYTVVKGEVYDNLGTPVKGVVVTLGSGTGARQKTTDVNGKFQFELGYQVSVSSLYSSAVDPVFKVSTKNLTDQGYPLIPITYGGTEYSQASDAGADIPLPFQVYYLTGSEADLGRITVKYYSEGDGPPPPPF
ncbi:MAG: hypothetical protein GX139_04935 [Armatimonadetes bacterium]|nr:hypothetical protein [Armatimonadota bacterium]